MNIKQRIKSLEGRMTLKTSDLLMKVYVAAQRAAEQWEKAGQKWPLPSHEIQKIPHLAEILDTKASTEEDQKLIESIRILVSRPLWPAQSDSEGEFIVMPSVAGPITVRFVKPTPEESLWVDGEFQLKLLHGPVRNGPAEVQKTDICGNLAR